MRATSGRGDAAGSISKLTAPMALVVLLSTCTIGDARADDDVQAGTEPLSAVELFLIYRNKTWRWDSGAGRFYLEGRRFLAWVSGEEGDGYAEGRYTLTDRGRLCIVATWVNAAGSTDSTTCFLHRGDGNTIYQKREGADQWYVFKHAQQTPSDEINKLVEVDEVTERVARIKAELPDE